MTSLHLALLIPGALVFLIVAAGLALVADGVRYVWRGFTGPPPGGLPRAVAPPGADVQRLRQVVGGFALVVVGFAIAGGVTYVTWFAYALFAHPPVGD